MVACEWVETALHRRADGLQATITDIPTLPPSTVRLYTC
jgi:hypothetical protein